MLRRPYTTRCRFFNDSEEETTIRWYRADPNAPTLPYTSAINSLQWRTHPWRASGVGEVYGSPTPYDSSASVPAYPGGHICGTEQQHSHGAEYNPLLFPIVYSASGLPVCCYPTAPIDAVGGVLLGGSATVVADLNYCTVYRITEYAQDLPESAELTWFGGLWLLQADTPEPGPANWDLSGGFPFHKYLAFGWTGQGCQTFTIVGPPSPGVPETLQVCCND